MFLDCMRLERWILPGEGTRLVGALFGESDGVPAEDEEPVVWHPLSKVIAERVIANTSDFFI